MVCTCPSRRWTNTSLGGSSLAIPIGVLDRVVELRVEVELLSTPTAQPGAVVLFDDRKKYVLTRDQLSAPPAAQLRARGPEFGAVVQIERRETDSEDRSLPPSTCDGPPNRPWAGLVGSRYSATAGRPPGIYPPRYTLRRVSGRCAVFFRQYELGCLSLFSYLIGDETTGRAVVVDPQRDVSQYLADAEATISGSSG